MLFMDAYTCNKNTKFTNLRIVITSKKKKTEKSNAFSQKTKQEKTKKLKMSKQMRFKKLACKITYIDKRLSVILYHSLYLCIF